MIPQLPQLERLLLDADVSVELEPYLRAVGFRVQLAIRTDADITRDSSILRWARRRRYVLVCHDKHRDKTTRLDLYPELYENGGKILRIGGPPGQEELTALGKILVHREKWRTWFAENDGVVIVTGEKAIYHTASELYTRIQPSLEGVDPVARMRHRRPSTRQQQKRPRQVPIEQGRLLR